MPCLAAQRVRARELSGFTTLHNRRRKTLRKVLVTGGAGYVGCILVPKLLNAGHEVVVYDLMLYGSDGLPSHPNLRVIQGDLRDTPSYAAAVRGMDSVIHL